MYLFLVGDAKNGNEINFTFCFNDKLTLCKRPCTYKARSINEVIMLLKLLVLHAYVKNGN